MKDVEIDEPVSFFDHVYLGCTQRDCKSNETIIEKYTKMFESRISAGATEKFLEWKKLHAKQLHGLVTWKDTLKNVWKGTGNLQTRKVEHQHKVSSPCWDDHQFKQEELENYLKYAHIYIVGQSKIIFFSPER